MTRMDPKLMLLLPLAASALTTMPTSLLSAATAASTSRAAVDVPSPSSLPSLPSFLPASAKNIEEEEARTALMQMRKKTVKVPAGGMLDVPTVFWESKATGTPTFAAAAAGEEEALAAKLVRRLKTAPMFKPLQAPMSFVAAARAAIGAAPKAPRVLLLHGADASTLEWRFLVPLLNKLGVSCTAVDWWSGGFTDRAQLSECEERASDPWDLYMPHLHAFWKSEMGGEPVVVVGASLGGAVALDFAASYPEAVAGLVLVDAGGESYKSPPPDVVSSLSSVALNVKRALAAVTSSPFASEELRINGLHRSEPQWATALGDYLKSGGYARKVGKELIQKISQPALVIWGKEDPILPLEDAYAFEQDLRRCVAVREVDGCGHTPQLEDPEPVALHIAQFCLELSER